MERLAPFGCSAEFEKAIADLATVAPAATEAFVPLIAKEFLRLSSGPGGPNKRAKTEDQG
jgi:hypothetical protein